MFPFELNPASLLKIKNHMRSLLNIYILTFMALTKIIGSAFKSAGKLLRSNAPEYLANLNRQSTC